MQTCLCQLPVSSDKSCSSFSSTEETSSQREIYVLLLGNKGEQRTLPQFVDIQLLSAQNNLYAKVAYFGISYSDLLQKLGSLTPVPVFLIIKLYLLC